MKASKALTMSVSVFRGQISWRFSLSKSNISPAAPDLELILFPLWYWPIMNAHTKQQQDKVFETDFIDSQKSAPPFAHLLALSHINIFRGLAGTNCCDSKNALPGQIIVYIFKSLAWTHFCTSKNALPGQIVGYIFRGLARTNGCVCIQRVGQDILM